MRYLLGVLPRPTGRLLRACASDVLAQPIGDPLDLLHVVLEVLLIRD